ncbi:hypothetical protein ABN763_11100 [Spongiivirga sp. MCCC 1A20706]|uniref:hypothetical protein n=1 Tax=Spongiivirga sp. MCCC 1A20706 TaxID=3160963 RepID=UPI003977DDAC
MVGIRLFSYILVLSLFGCNQLKEEKKKISVIPEHRNGFLEIEFLKEAPFYEAERINNLYLFNKEYLLYEIRPFFRYRILLKVYDSSDFDKPIPMKEVTWERSKNYNVTVFYQKKDTTWQPVLVDVVGKDVKF